MCCPLKSKFLDILIFAIIWRFHAFMNMLNIYREKSRVNYGVFNVKLEEEVKEMKQKYRGTCDF